MLARLELGHFKCFEDLSLPLGSLTLLSGSNASGKSSVLQALALLHQTIRHHEWSTRLLLNGEAVRLGTVSDVVDEVHGRRGFEIGIVDADAVIRWKFSGDGRSEMSMATDRVDLDGVDYERPATLRYLIPPNVNDKANALALRLHELTYITAERIGPREVYPIEDQQASPVVGPQGEHAVSVLHWGRDEKVLETLALESAVPSRLRQVEARMRTLFPGCGLDVQQIPQANSVTVGLRTFEGGNFHRPIHVGYGLTQVLPIFVAALSARRDGLMLIENPEVHLHPAGQALMGQFLAEVASAGIQVIVETHSDHVLNGVRRAVKSGKLIPEQVAIHFFRPRTLEEVQVVSPTLDSRGNVDSWPNGFFDQFDKDMNHFAGWAD
jgi:predicted ATPase